MTYYAHSPDEKKGVGGQTYADHVSGVVRRSEAAAAAILPYARRDGKLLCDTVAAAAELHDLGKLDGENQRVLSGKVRAKKLPVHHADAGAAYLLGNPSGISFAALAVQSHHSGYPDFCDEGKKGAKAFRDETVFEQVNAVLPCLVEIHQGQFRNCPVEKGVLPSGDASLFLRLVLSCLADADHTDTTIHYGEYAEPDTLVPLRPAERLARLDKYIAGFGNNTDERSLLRTEMYYACRNSDTGEVINSCDSPVGSGKTTAVMAHLLAQAEKRGLRRIFIILPFTNIIRQSVKKYRETLVFPGENPEQVVAELHHRADFQSMNARQLTALWKAPIIVTTAVAFFETLAANSPASLRRLHQLPGSAVFVDESHAALPVKLLPLAWRWIQRYADEWGCYWVLASGSLTRFWEINEISETKRRVPEITDNILRNQLAAYEVQRVRYRYHPEPKRVKELAEWVTSFPGPRLLILNTVQSAAVAADFFAKTFGRKKVEHLSTALTPKDREKILKRIEDRLLDSDDTDWTLVATSCVEAGVDLSFRTGFRELASLMSLLQLAGRINRHGGVQDAEVWSFCIAAVDNLKLHPAFKHASGILRRYFDSGKEIRPELCTDTIMEEIILLGSSSIFKQLIEQENVHSFKFIEANFRVIDTDTRIAVADKELISRLKKHEKVSWRDIQLNSVQVWKPKTDYLGLPELRNGLYEWHLPYDDFIGYMAGILPIENFNSFEPGACVV
ncbi:hypothetical protein K7I13_01920 [Brucepastera parasyntrophica]|uniref:DEAD/DEAH box helicase n=1 Tax=Brucepastera parasyntrophica TaxID=2880008 RepID=UPI00210DA3FB|nr:DEAD/DEAH box helicase [Brucepastera parasyntrophica]ULQ60108.1 hypothetical protein K7I13_01920 [Brucepastera parasyntrophica]